MNTNHTAEKRTADTLLQRKPSVTIGGRTYTVPTTTLEILVSVSEQVSVLPTEMINNDKETVITLSLRHAKDYGALASVLATLLLPTHTMRIAWLSWIYSLRHRRLTRRIRYTASQSELMNATKTILGGMEIADFFGLTAFLAGINMTKPTTKAETETTASGQRSEDL